MASESVVAAELDTEEILGVNVTTLVDNQTASVNLNSVHGLSMLVEVQFPDRSEAILIDTSGSAQVFRHNIQVLQMDFANLRAIVITHYHYDHFGALEPVLEYIGHQDFMVYLPTHHIAVESILNKFNVGHIIAEEAHLIRSGIATTGALGPKTLKEQAVVLNIETRGLVLFTGCAHPKITRLIKAAKKAFPERDLYAIIGGLHLKTEEEGKKAGELFVKEGIKLVSPNHCTTQMAKNGIRAKVGDVVYRPNGSGTSFTF